MEFAADTGPVFEKIGLSRIDPENRFFKITRDEEPLDREGGVSFHALKTTISRLGLISPPVLKTGPSHTFMVVAGFRRIAACRDLGWHKIPAFVFGPDADDGQLMRISITDNACKRSLDIIEQATAVSKLLPYLPGDKASWYALFEEIGLNVNPGMIAKLQKIHGAPEDLKGEMGSGKISLTVGLELMDMDENARKSFLMIFKALNPTLNHQKEMIRMMRDISAREGQSISQLLDSLRISAIVHDSEEERNRKISRIRQRLKKQRYPEIAAFEKTYHERRGRLALPESLRLYPPPDFEGNDFLVHFSFRNLSQFKEGCETLQSLGDHPDFAAILEKK